MKQFPQCQIHPESEIELLQISDNRLDLYCSQCIYSLQDEANSINFQKIIHLKMIQKDPEGFLYRIQPKFEKKRLEGFIISDQYIKFLEKSLLQIQECKVKVEQLFDETKLKLNQAKSSQQEMRNSLLQIIQFDQLFVNNTSYPMDNDLLPDDVKQTQNSLTKKLQDIQNNLTKIYVQIQEATSPLQEVLVNQQKEFIQQFKKSNSLLNLHYQTAASQYSILAFNSSIIDLGYFQQLCQKVESRLAYQIQNVQQLFRGSKDGLKVYNLKQKIDKQSKLLFIFQSKSSHIFGIFFAGIFYENSKNSDQTLASFIFSYTYQEIYPLKQSSNACINHYSSYIGFGGNNEEDCDIFISEDFQKGTQNWELDIQ